MGDVLINIIDWLSGLPPTTVYFVILGVAYLENVVPPLPGDMIVVFGGYMAGLGLLNPWLVVVVSTIGGSLGFLTMYGIGYRVGLGILDPHRYSWLPRQNIRKVKAQLQKWGFKLVAANRFLSGLRSVISLTVGMAHMTPGRTALWCTVSSFVWTALITGAGYYVGENWAVVGDFLRAYGLGVTVLIVLFGLIKGIRYWIKLKKEKLSD